MNPVKLTVGFCFGTAALVVVGGILIGVEIDLAIWTGAIAGGWFGNFGLAFFFTMGHGLNQKTEILGFPAWLAAYLGIILTILLFLAFNNTNFDGKTATNLWQLTISGFVALGMAIIYWFAYARKAYHYESEYVVRCRSSNPQVAVPALRDAGILRPMDESTK